MSAVSTEPHAAKLTAAPLFGVLDKNDAAHHSTKNKHSRNLKITNTPSTKKAKPSDDSECRSVTPQHITTKCQCHCSQFGSSSSSVANALSDNEIKDLLKTEAGYDTDSDQAVSKRPDYICWDDYFMATAVLSSLRSKDPHHPAGCCIVDRRNRIIGIGYNGFPMQCSDDVLPWVEPAKDVPFLHTFEPYVVHAIVNAILCSGDVQGARLYVSEYPCAECAKTIIQAGISEVIFKSKSAKHPPQSQNGDSLAASRIMFQMAGVKVRAFAAAQPKVDLVRLEGTDSMLPETTPVDAKKESMLLSKQYEIVRKEANLESPVCTKRTEYLSWDDYFMWMAFLTAQRSKDPNTQVGACLVLNQRIVGLGYNGFPIGCSDDFLPWARQGKSPLHTKYPFVCHAEVNAIMNRIFPNVRGATLYVALFPCNECTKFIIQAGIKEVVYLDDKYHDTDICRASRIMLNMAGVNLRQHTPVRESLTLLLDERSLDQEKIE